MLTKDIKKLESLFNGGRKNIQLLWKSVGGTSKLSRITICNSAPSNGSTPKDIPKELQIDTHIHAMYCHGASTHKAETLSQSTSA